MSFDVLVLGGGGTLGEAWMSGVLAGLRDATGWDPREARAFVGTSAGSIVAASLAAGRAPRRPAGGPPVDVDARGGRPRRPAAASRALAVAGSAVAPLGLAATAPAGRLVRGAVLRRLPEGTRSLAGLAEAVRGWGAAFDGRLRITAVDRDTGARVVFGSAGAPRAEVAEAVQASCAIPGVFRPVVIGGRTYVDGGAWSPLNLDAAPAGRGDRVLVLEPMAVLARGALRAAGAVEALALRRRGAEVELVAPGAQAAPRMRRLMDQDRDGAVLAAGYAQGLALGAGAHGPRPGPDGR